MKQIIKKSGREIAKYLVISLFFTSFLITLVGIFFSKPISSAISLVDKISFEVVESDNSLVKFDDIKKRLLRYPNYGTIWANLKINKINLDLPVYHGDELDILRYGVGHLAGSYFPGEGGSIIMPAHNSREYFRRLPELSNGDKIVVEAIYGKYTYEVYKTDIITKYETNKLPIVDSEEVLMLYTCYPVTEVGLTNRRYVVYAKLVGRENEK